MKTKAKVRYWGSSLGIVIPVDVVKKERIRNGDEIFIEIKKKSKIKDAFAMLRDWNMDEKKIRKEISVSQ